MIHLSSLRPPQSLVAKGHNFLSITGAPYLQLEATMVAGSRSGYHGNHFPFSVLHIYYAFEPDKALNSKLISSFAWQKTWCYLSLDFSIKNVGELGMQMI